MRELYVPTPAYWEELRGLDDQISQALQPLRTLGGWVCRFGHNVDMRQLGYWVNHKLPDEQVGVFCSMRPWRPNSRKGQTRNIGLKLGPSDNATVQGPRCIYSVAITPGREGLRALINMPTLPTVQKASLSDVAQYTKTYKAEAAIQDTMGVSAPNEEDFETVLEHMQYCKQIVEQG